MKIFDLEEKADLRRLKGMTRDDGFSSSCPKNNSPLNH
jgi:hypothetical protein